MQRRRLLLAMVCATGTSLADAPAPARFGPNEGEVLEIDRKELEITIRHGPLPELSMDPMSMIFKVGDVALLDRVRAGDRVRFKAGLLDGRFAVLSIERVRK
jgi:Cu(I)/Ag(I) efflux system periplasmic protein CusF